MELGMLKGLDLSRILAVTTTLVAGGALSLTVATAEEFYRGKTIDLNICCPPGGTYDIYARLVGLYMAKHIPGNPRIIPRQMVGAGSRVVGAYMFSLAPKDGTQLATADQGMALQQILGEGASNFDVGKFVWIGNPISDNNTMAAWHQSRVSSIDDAKKHEVTVGANPDTVSAQYPQFLNNMIGTKFKIIQGYPGGSDVNLAMENGEVAVRGQNSWSSWKSQHAAWLSQKKINIIVQVGFERAHDLPGVPLLVDLARTPNDRAAAHLLSAPTVIGRPLFTSPGTPKERIDALRLAFDRTMVDPDFLEAAKKGNLDINAVSGADLQKIIDELFGTRPEVVTNLKKLLAAPL
jgi:tripartite-type tricarboxylate transporter receptor subunit TctC